MRFIILNEKGSHFSEMLFYWLTANNLHLIVDGKLQEYSLYAVLDTGCRLYWIQ